MKGLFAFMMANIIAVICAGFWANVYGSRKPLPRCSFPIHFRGSLIVFVPSWLGFYLEWGFWAHFALMGIFGLMLWYYLRIGRAVRIN